MMQARRKKDHEKRKKHLRPVAERTHSKRGRNRGRSSNFNSYFYMGDDMTEVNKKAFDLIEKGEPPKIEKLVSITIRPNFNNWAEFFRDASLGVAGLCFTVIFILKVIE